MVAATKRGINSVIFIEVTLKKRLLAPPAYRQAGILGVKLTLF